MTPKMQQILDTLRANVEMTSENLDGSRWGDVYIPNVGNTQELAGVLSALAKEGLYKPLDKFFGEVKL